MIYRMCTKIRNYILRYHEGFFGKRRNYVSIQHENISSLNTLIVIQITHHEENE